MRIQAEIALQIPENGWEVIFEWMKIQDLDLLRGAVTCIANIASNGT